MSDQADVNEGDRVEQKCLRTFTGLDSISPKYVKTNGLMNVRGHKLEEADDSRADSGRVRPTGGKKTSTFCADILGFKQ